MRPLPAAGRREPGRRRLAPAPLPVPLTPLVGRTAQVAAVTSAVPGCRLVTLTGTGGTGKTRVALQAAAELAGRFPDGTAFADLAPVGDPELVGVTLLRALGLTPQSAATAEDQLIAALRPVRVLLIADNMEHLIEQAPLLRRLLAAAPGLHLLVTSRVGLGLYGEHQLRVPPLRLPGPATPAADSEAVQLFVRRARAVAPGFDPRGEDLAATAAICAALDGLPLAIELAAARIRLYPPQALLPTASGAAAAAYRRATGHAAASADVARHPGLERRAADRRCPGPVRLPGCVCGPVRCCRRRVGVPGRRSAGDDRAAG